MKTGDKVRFINNERHITEPEYYPKGGSVGTVLDIDEDDKDNLYVEWPEGSTSSDDCWWCGEEDVEPVDESEDEV